MALKKLALLALVPTLAITAATQAADETRVRQENQNTKIVGTPGQNVFWSMSGLPNAVIATPFCNATVAQICANPSAFGVYQVESNSGGQFTLRFCKVFKSQWINQQACVYLNGTLVDGDKFVTN
jgi:hypothetical protein